MAKKKAEKVDPAQRGVDSVGEIKSVAEELLNLIGIEGSVDVSEDKENKLSVVQVETDQAGILIGHRGETLGAYEVILKQILFSKNQEPSNIVVNVGDWKEKREQTLQVMAQKAAERVKDTGTPQHIFDLSPSERRFVHMLFSESSEVATESEGEGRDRHLVVKLK